MEKLIEANKGKVLLCILLLAFTTSCSTVSDLDNRINFIRVSSVLDVENCTIKINDNVYLDNVKITTDRSIGVDLSNVIKFKSKENPRIEVVFNGYTTPDLELKNKRKLSLDTVINIRKGKYILISARIDEIEFFQQKKEFVLN